VGRSRIGCRERTSRIRSSTWPKTVDLTTWGSALRRSASALAKSANIVAWPGRTRLDPHTWRHRCHHRPSSRRQTHTHSQLPMSQLPMSCPLRCMYSRASWSHRRKCKRRADRPRANLSHLRQRPFGRHRVRRIRTGPTCIARTCTDPTSRRGEAGLHVQAPCWRSRSCLGRSLLARCYSYATQNDPKPHPPQSS